MTAVSDLHPTSEPEPVGGLPIPDRVVLDDGATLALHHDADLGVVVVEVSGLAAGDWADSLALELLALGPDLRLVVDVSPATLVDPASLCAALDTVLAAGSDPHRVCLVCERLSALVLLRRYGATEQVAVFGSSRDAIQALVMHIEGYGPGWAPSLSV